MNTLWDHKAAAKATGGKSTGEWLASRVEIDSRKVKPGDLFVALKGENHDGHAFVDDAFSKGAVAAMVHDGSLKTKGQILLVGNTLLALEQLAKAARARSKAKIVGVTGSVGKTGTKEMLRLALAAHGATHATSGNYNNHIGLPLSLVNMPLDTKYAVFEMGMNHAGEIEHLSKITCPHVAVITTVEAVHSEFFESVEAIADAKAEIFEGMEDGTAVLNAHNPYTGRLEVAAIKNGLHILRVGKNETCDCRLVSAGRDIVADFAGKRVHYYLPSLGEHMISNSLMALAAVHALGLDAQKSAAALSAFREPEGRGQVKELTLDGKHIIFIDDSYNASPVSMRAAFAKTQLVWEQKGSKGRKLAALGDMLELGKDAAQQHAGLAKDLAGFDVVFTAGSHMEHLHQALPGTIRGDHTARANDLLPLIKNALKPDDVLLIKGSHGSQMYLLAKSLTTIAEGLETKHAV